MYIYTVYIYIYIYIYIHICIYKWVVNEVERALPAWLKNVFFKSLSSLSLNHFLHYQLPVTVVVTVTVTVTAKYNGQTKSLRDSSVWMCAGSAVWKTFFKTFDINAWSLLVIYGLSGTKKKHILVVLESWIGRFSSLFFFLAIFICLVACRQSIAVSCYPTGSREVSVTILQTVTHTHTHTHT